MGFVVARMLENLAGLHLEVGAFAVPAHVETAVCTHTAKSNAPKRAIAK